MDVAAAIRAQTTQLEMQQQQRKKKKQHPNNNNNQTTESQLSTGLPHSNNNNYPVKSLSFHDERNHFNPYAQQSQQYQYEGRFPHYVNSEYQFENKDIDCEDADSITSSLSGTLPGTTDNLSLNNYQYQLTSTSPTRELQKLDSLKATVKAELDELRSANSNSQSTNHNNISNQNHSNLRGGSGNGSEGSKQQQQQQPQQQQQRSQQTASKSLPPPKSRNHFGGSNNNTNNTTSSGGIVNLSSSDNITTASAAKSVGSTGTRERITPGGNIIVMDTESENEDNNDRGGAGAGAGGAGGYSIHHDDVVNAISFTTSRQSNNSNNTSKAPANEIKNFDDTAHGFLLNLRTTTTCVDRTQER